MRFIFKILIGMILFNAFLFLFSNPTYFGTDVPQQGTNITDSDLTSYQPGTIDFAYDIIAVGAGIFGISLLLNFFTHNPAWVGAGVIMAFIFGLWRSASGNIEALFTGYPLAGELYSILTICFGVIATIAVVEIFTGRSSDD